MGLQDLSPCISSCLSLETVLNSVWYFIHLHKLSLEVSFESTVRHRAYKSNITCNKTTANQVSIQLVASKTLSDHKCTRLAILSPIQAVQTFHTAEPLLENSSYSCTQWELLVLLLHDGLNGVKDVRQDWHLLCYQLREYLQYTNC